MRILIFGGSGMLGHKLVQALGARFDVWATIRGEFSVIESFGIFDGKRTIAQVDVTDISAVRRAIETARADVVINAAGIVKQLSESTNVIQALRVNSVFPQRLAGLARQYEFRLITISTDCVFSGEMGKYSEADVPDAHDLYGVSKLLGEVRGENCLTIRTSIVGRELATAHGLVEWFLSNRGKAVKGYVNAIYSGFPTTVLSEILSTIIVDHPELEGIYHVSSEPISKFELLGLLNEYFQADVKVVPFEDFAVDRTLDSTAFRDTADFSPRSWEQMIEQMAADPTPYNKWRT